MVVSCSQVTSRYPRVLVFQAMNHKSARGSTSSETVENIMVEVRYFLLMVTGTAASLFHLPALHSGIGAQVSFVSIRI